MSLAVFAVCAIGAAVSIVTFGAGSVLAGAFIGASIGALSTTAIKAGEELSTGNVRSFSEAARDVVISAAAGGFTGACLIAFPATAFFSPEIYAGVSLTGRASWALGDWSMSNDKKMAYIFDTKQMAVDFSIGSLIGMLVPGMVARKAARDAERNIKKYICKSDRTSGKIWDYSKQFDGELANFNAGYEIKNVIDEDLHLVQFHSNAEVGSGRSLKYWTTFDEANGISTVDDYMNQMALLSNWGARDNVSIAKIPAGTKIKYAIGTAKEQVGAIESRPGGGLQILFEQFDDGWILDTRSLP